MKQLLTEEDIVRRASAAVRRDRLLGLALALIALAMLLCLLFRMKP